MLLNDNCNYILLKSQIIHQTSSGQLEEQEAPGSGAVTVTVTATSDNNDETVIPSIRIVTVEEQETAQSEVTTETLELTPTDGKMP